MCGRFTITLEPAFFQQELDLGNLPSEWVPRYNAAPGQLIPAVKDAGARNVTMLRWGLVPHWAKDASIGYKMINARSETLLEKPSFKNAFKSQRCLILADGFYEWQKPASKGAPKAPFRFTLKDGQPFTFAGLWESWSSPDNEHIQTCTIITCQPNDLLAQIHNRMPVILDRNSCWDWLAEKPESDLAELLKPYPSDAMTGYPVGQMVNNSRFDNIECIKPLEI
jgi:putative SOS response-associated peptidase YedK